MHLIVMARGIKPQLEQWENCLLSKYFNINDANAGLKPGEVAKLQLGLRPIRFYDIAFPEPMMNEVLQLIQPGKSWTPAFNKYYYILQKLMKLEKMPDIPPPNINNFMPRDWAEVVGIGIKKDKWEVVKKELI